MIRLAVLLLVALIGLCSCAKQVPPPVVVVPAVIECPAPSVPALPQLDPSLPLDSFENVHVLMLRDDALRGYIKGLESAILCYRKQIQQPAQ